MLAAGRALATELDGGEGSGRLARQGTRHPAERAGLVPDRVRCPTVRLEMTDRFVVTVHGIGPYSAGQGAVARLASTLRSVDSTSVGFVEFNWCALVERERDDRKHLAQLARSLIIAAHVGCDKRKHRLAWLAHAAGASLELVLKSALSMVAVFGLLLVPALAVYTRFGTFGEWYEHLARFARDAILTVGTWPLWTTGACIGLAAVLAMVGQRILAASLVRRAILVVAQPILSLTFHLGTADAATLFKRIAVGSFAYGALAGAMHSCSPDSARQWSGLTLSNLAVIGGAFAAAFVVAVALSRVVIAPVKLARDIFNYIGDASQRSVIQDGLERELAKIPTDADVILIGHSLGSVIAVDSLANSAAWKRFARVSLVTGGSPIRRCFQRFFPGLYFARKPDHLISRLQRRSGVVRWINVYRSGVLFGDPVGQRLFESGSAATDIPVRQRERRFLAAHYDYWGDPQIVGAVEQAWHPTMATLETQHAEEFDEPQRHSRIFDALARSAQRLSAWSAGVGFVLSVACCFSIVAERRAEARSFMARVRLEGETATAQMTHWTTTWGYGEDLSFPVQRYEFAFQDDHGLSRSVSLFEAESSSFDGGLYFDSAKFRESIGRDESTEKRSFEVKVLYLPDVPDRLTLAAPRFHAEELGFPVFELLWVGFGPILFPVILLLGGALYFARVTTRVLLPPSAEPADHPVENTASDDRRSVSLT